jgi:hypothetical protein
MDNFSNKQSITIRESVDKRYEFDAPKFYDFNKSTILDYKYTILILGKTI